MTRIDFLEQYVLARIPTKHEMKYITLDLVEEGHDFYDKIHGVKRFDTPEEDDETHPEAHDWQHPMVGFYDTTWTCTRCQAKHTERVDDPTTLLPTLGCKP